MKQVRFGKLAFLQLNGAFFEPKNACVRPFRTTFSARNWQFGTLAWKPCTFSRFEGHQVNWMVMPKNPCFCAEKCKKYLTEPNVPVHHFRNKMDQAFFIEKVARNGFCMLGDIFCMSWAFPFCNWSTGCQRWSSLTSLTVAQTSDQGTTFPERRDNQPECTESLETGIEGSNLSPYIGGGESFEFSRSLRNDKKKFSTIKFELSKFYCRGVSHEKNSVFGRFSSPPPRPTPLKSANLFLLSSRRL